MGMDVEISGEFLDCSSYWPIALVANNSHFIDLDAPPNWRSPIRLNTSHATIECTQTRGDEGQNSQQFEKILKMGILKTRSDSEPKSE